jgi:hypothetical protein
MHENKMESNGQPPPAIILAVATNFFCDFMNLVPQFTIRQLLNLVHFLYTASTDKEYINV